MTHYVMGCRCGGLRHTMPDAAGLHCFECGRAVSRADVNTHAQHVTVPEWVRRAQSRELPASDRTGAIR